MPSKKQPVHVLIAPNAFKNSLPADEVAAALTEGLMQSRANITIRSCPVGDGGDGTGKILAFHLHARKQMYKTVDPLGRPVTAPVYYTSDGTAIIELSDASGLKLLPITEYDPIRTSTFGTGILIKKALGRKVRRMVLAIGGSATVDGGTGILKALGVRFLNREGIAIQNLPQDLYALHSIDTSGMDTRIKQTELVILCDVKNKLLGTKGAARIFGPQKGATAENIASLQKNLRRLDKIIQQTSGIKMSALPYSGAAGGVAASLTALCNARAVNGIDFFLDTIQFTQQLQNAGIVITGEGALDAQTLEGKAPLGVALNAKRAGIKVIGVAGKTETGNKKLLHYFDQLININKPSTSLAQALRDTRINLIKTGKKIGRQIKANSV